MSQMKPSIETEAISGNLGSFKIDREAVLDSGMAVAILATIEVVEDVSAI